MDDRIEKRLELKAPVSRVWRALTDYREFGDWFGVKLDGPFVAGRISRGTVPATALLVAVPLGLAPEMLT